MIVQPMKIFFICINCLANDSTNLSLKKRHIIKKNTHTHLNDQTLTA